MGFYNLSTLTGDAKRHGLEVLRPDVNISGANCSVERDALRIGLKLVARVRMRQHLIDPPPCHDIPG
jgi:DNA polymerase III alpha subunit